MSDDNTIVDDNIVNNDVIVDTEIKQRKITRLVLCGGSEKGIIHIGALMELDKLNILTDITHFATTSVGSIIIALYLCGYKINDLWTFVTAFNFDKLKKINLAEALNNYGIDNGDNLDHTIKKLIGNKTGNPNLTMAELYEDLVNSSLLQRPY